MKGKTENLVSIWDVVMNDPNRRDEIAMKYEVENRRKSENIFNMALVFIIIADIFMLFGVSEWLPMWFSVAVSLVCGGASLFLFGRYFEYKKGGIRYE